MGQSHIAPWAFNRDNASGLIRCKSPKPQASALFTTWHLRKGIMDLQYDISAGRETFSTCQERDNILQTCLQYNQAGQQQTVVYSRLRNVFYLKNYQHMLCSWLESKSWKTTKTIEKLENYTKHRKAEKLDYLGFLVPSDPTNGIWPHI